MKFNEDCHRAYGVEVLHYTEQEADRILGRRGEDKLKAGWDFGGSFLSSSLHRGPVVFLVHVQRFALHVDVAMYM